MKGESVGGRVGRVVVDIAVINHNHVDRVRRCTVEVDRDASERVYL